VPLYLADSSTWIGRRRPRAEYLGEFFNDRNDDGEIATCVPVALVVLVGPPDAAAYDQDWELIWKPLVWLPLSEQATERALEVQRELAHTTTGAHRRRPIDYLIAACAEASAGEVVLWHWDSDLTIFCEHTGQPQEPDHARAREHGIRGATESL
jgi:predicted nucleic acid-binding protein